MKDGVSEVHIDSVEPSKPQAEFCSSISAGGGDGMVGEGENVRRAILCLEFKVEVLNRSDIVNRSRTSAIIADGKQW